MQPPHEPDLRHPGHPRPRRSPERCAGRYRGAFARAGRVIVTIGDYVDKGPASKEVVERLLSAVEAPWKLVALKGNHDAMMVEALWDPSRMRCGWERG